MADTFMTLKNGYVIEVVQLKDNGKTRIYKPHNPYTCRQPCCHECIWSAYD